MFVCVCAERAEEMAQLQEALEEARGDLADQQDVIAGVLAQRDAFQVEVRRLQFILQFTVSPDYLAVLCNLRSYLSLSLYVCAPCAPCLCPCWAIDFILFVPG